MRVRWTFDISSGPNFLVSAFIEREGGVVSVGVINKRGDDYAQGDMTLQQFREAYETIMKGVK